jgi:hypothetical protein
MTLVMLPSMLARLGLLAQALVDQHIRIDGHAGRQRDAGEARQREGAVDEGHDAEDQERVHGEGDVRDDAREEVVPQHH